MKQITDKKTKPSPARTLLPVFVPGVAVLFAAVLWLHTGWRCNPPTLQYTQGDASAWQGIQLAGSANARLAELEFNLQDGRLTSRSVALPQKRQAQNLFYADTQWMVDPEKVPEVDRSATVEHQYTATGQVYSTYLGTAQNFVMMGKIYWQDPENGTASNSVNLPCARYTALTPQEVAAYQSGDDSVAVKRYQAVGNQGGDQTLLQASLTELPAVLIGQTPYFVFCDPQLDGIRPLLGNGVYKVTESLSSLQEQSYNALNGGATAYGEAEQIAALPDSVKAIKMQSVGQNLVLLFEYDGTAVLRLYSTQGVLLDEVVLGTLPNAVPGYQPLDCLHSDEIAVMETKTATLLAARIQGDAIQAAVMRQIDNDVVGVGFSEAGDALLEVARRYQQGGLVTLRYGIDVQKYSDEVAAQLTSAGTTTALLPDGYTLRLYRENNGRLPLKPTATAVLDVGEALYWGEYFPFCSRLGYRIVPQLNCTERGA